MSSKNYHYVIISYFLSNVSFYYINAQLEDSAKGVIWSVLAGLIISIIIAQFYIKTFNKFPSKSIADVSKLLFGKKIGLLVTLIFVIANSINGLFMFAGGALITQKFIMVGTPLYIIGFFMLIVVFSSFRNSENTMLNLIGFVTLVSLILYLIFVVIAFKDVDFGFVKGTYYHSITGVPSLRKISYSCFFFSGVEALAVYNPVLPKISLKKTCFTYIFIGLPIAFLTLTIPIGIWGPIAINKIRLPIILSADAIGLDLFVIERVLFILYPVIFLICVTSACSYIFLGYSVVKSKLKTNRTYALHLLVFIMFLFVVKDLYEVEVLNNLAQNFKIIWFFYQCGLSFALFIFSRKKVQECEN